MRGRTGTLPRPAGGRRLVAAGLAAGLAAAAPAVGQARTADNAVTGADDAFGFSVGRESIGIYSAGNTRGFSPAQAGNVRLDGLFFDELADLGDALVGSVGIKVGLAAQGYPFAAPSGVVDIALRRPAARDGASVVANTDSFGTLGVEVDGSLGLTPTLRLGWGLTGGARRYPDGTTNTSHGQSLLLRWRPSGRVELVPFWSLGNVYADQAGPFFLPAGAFLPPAPPFHRFDGPRWVGNRTIAGTQGVLATLGPAGGWTVRAGLFRSVLDQPASFSNFVADERPDGTGERIVDADPRALGRSVSGELRVARTLADGPRSHTVQLGLRGRDTRRQFGGTAEVDLGPGRVGQAVDAPEPAFAFGPVSADHVRQVTLGLSYEGRWRGVGALGLSVGRASYRDDVALAGEPRAATAARPLVGDATLAVQLAGRLVAYAGYARGLEQSGVAPSTATNRNQPLGAVATSQRDAGLRWRVAGDLKLVAGVFALTRPYFDFDAAGGYGRVGAIRSRGVELSVNGHLAKALTLVAGGYLLDARVEPDAGIAAAAAAIGRRPVGLRPSYASANLDWRTPVKGVTLDLRASRRGRVAATADDAVFLPPHLDLAPGARYAFRLARHAASVRVQVTNLLDDRYLGLAGPGIYVAQGRRYANGYLAVDL